MSRIRCSLLSTNLSKEKLNVYLVATRSSWTLILSAKSFSPYFLALVDRESNTRWKQLTTARKNDGTASQ